MSQGEHIERNVLVFKAHEEGKNHQKIANEFGITRTRVWQIIQQHQRNQIYKQMRERDEKRKTFSNKHWAFRIAHRVEKNYPPLSSVETMMLYAKCISIL